MNARGSLGTECSPRHFYEPSDCMTNSKWILNMPFDWYGASNLLSGSFKAYLGQDGFGVVKESVQAL